MRILDRVLSVVLALALVAIGIIVPVEVIFALAGGEGALFFPYQGIASFFQERQWSSGVVIALSALVAAVGLLLLLAELWRRRPGLFAMSTDSGTVTAGISPRSLERVLAGAAAGVSGITGASASVHRRSAVVDAVTPLRDPGDLAGRAQARVDAAMESLDLVQSVPVRVRLRQPRGHT